MGTRQSLVRQTEWPTPLKIASMANKQGEFRISNAKGYLCTYEGFLGVRQTARECLAEYKGTIEAKRRHLCCGAERFLGRGREVVRL